MKIEWMEDDCLEKVSKVCTCTMQDAQCGLVPSKPYNMVHLYYGIFRCSVFLLMANRNYFHMNSYFTLYTYMYILTPFVLLGQLNIEDYSESAYKAFGPSSDYGIATLKRKGKESLPIDGKCSLDISAH